MKESNEILSYPLCKEFKRVRTIGNWHVLSKITEPCTVCVCDGFSTYWGLVYDNGSIGYDFPERIPESVKAWVRSVYTVKYALD